ncbi:hypothetical protein [Flavobacterium davisii]|uniref:hypothetical protein n=1 Tax=Flavobacterium davisii TaxID=2906077 RepID=UPI0035CFD3DF
MPLALLHLYITQKTRQGFVQKKGSNITKQKYATVNVEIKKAKGSPAEEKPKSKKEESGLLNPISETLGEIWDWVETQGTALRDKPHTIEIPEGKSPL